MSGKQHPQQILGMRYRIVQQLGQGGFGRTYLAEDLNRFNERCVLKEFVPQVHEASALQKAEELFQREAGILYRLQHAQIPRFRELLRVGSGQYTQLYLVQDYIDGRTYRDLLEERKRQGQCFSEYEITDLLRQILPVIQYLHGAGVIHRDIAPDNLMLRETDGLPVLIDFGAVKQIAVTVEEQFSGGHSGDPAHTVTRLGKIGYAPEEQMQSGLVSPSVDLYALGVTVLVLLTGKEPAHLFDRRNLSWTWRQHVQLNPTLGQILDKLLAHYPRDRYQSATEVLQALSAIPGSPPSSPSPPPPSSPPPAPPSSPSLTQQATVAVGRRLPPRRPPTPAPPMRPSMPKPRVSAAPAPSEAPVVPARKTTDWFWKVVLGILLLSSAIASVWLVWWVATQWEPTRNSPSAAAPTQSPNAGQNQTQQPESNSSSSQLPAQERQQSQALQDRREALGISSDFFNVLVNSQFYSRYPEQQGKTLSASDTDAPWRERWRDVGSDLLDVMDKQLSDEARQNLGSYTAVDTERWRSDVNQQHVGIRSLNDLADARFFHLFPDLRNQNFANQPVGQLWYAIAADEVQALKSGETLEEIRLKPDENSEEMRDRLKPGEGKVYILDLSEGQTLDVSLNAPGDAAQLSIYLPSPTEENPFILEDSDEAQWSGDLPQSGYYEVVVVSKTDKPFEYRLSLNLENGDSGASEGE